MYFPSKKSKRQRVRVTTEKYTYFTAKRPLQIKSSFLILWIRHPWRTKEVKWLPWVTTMISEAEWRFPLASHLLVYAPVLSTLFYLSLWAIKNPRKPVFRGQFWTAQFSSRSYIYLNAVCSWSVSDVKFNNCFSGRLLVCWPSLNVSSALLLFWKTHFP